MAPILFFVVFHFRSTLEWYHSNHSEGTTKMKNDKKRGCTISNRSSHKGSVKKSKRVTGELL